MSVDTIAAIATPPGRGGVGIIRLSGPQSYAIAIQLNANTALTPRVAHFCSFHQSSEVIDYGLMIYFKAPNSFTGEDIVEIQAHGSPVVLDCLLKEVVNLGARLARPGEFSERAFLNGKIDLTQAEAIADLILACSETAARMAINSLQGDFSKKINSLNEQIVFLRMYVEAAIDFPEEEIDFLNDGKVTQLLSNILKELDALRKEANQGVILREGVSLVIAGRPNVGKSTLINCLAGKELAIVTEIAGTTRDVMREHILLDDIPVHIIDTAGIRQSDCLIEQEGIKRAWQELKRADLILHVVDVNADSSDSSLVEEIQEKLDQQIPIITLFNKTDIQGLKPKQVEQSVYLSAKENQGIDLLKSMIKKLIGYQANEGHFLARRRHLQALDQAKQCLEIGQKQLNEHHAGELLAEDLRAAHHALCEITGEFSSDELLGKIFSSFCIGK